MHRRIRRFLAACLVGTGLVFRPAFAAVLSPEIVYTGMCDASGAVALDTNHFAVASDEDSILRVYSAERGGAPVQAFDVSKFLKLDPKKPETDLEAACWLGDRAFWISSQGRNRTAKYRSNRHYLFATSFQKTSDGFRLTPEGQPYHNLLDDLLSDPRLKPFNLDAASRLAPKSPGALNIEGLCATPEGHLLIGFRNPLPRGRALLVPLLNPLEVIAGTAAKLGDPLLLDLGGRGVRDIEPWDGGYLIAAGPAESGDDFALYTWAGPGAVPQKLDEVHLRRFHAEVILVYPDRPGIIELLSDDGTRTVNGVPCRELPAVSRQFRGAWVTLPETARMPGAGKTGAAGESPDR